MIEYTRHILPNGLTFLCHTDRGTPFVSVNVLYKVGSRNESPERTGLAHLFEHLMFGGSANIADFDREVQMAGGDSNAYTTNDYTNYYITIPAANLETALWLESDRMMQLSFSQHALEVQQQVVIEEFKQRYLNAPYGDVWLKLRPLAYKVHPYRWATIGISTEQIAAITLQDIQDFYYRYYCPNNAILSISGNISTEQAFTLVEKWFGAIPSRALSMPPLLQEPPQEQARQLISEKRKVPANALYKVYHMGGRTSENFYICDIISDILSNGQSSRLYRNLIKDNCLFSSIDAYVTGEKDPGLFVISGKLQENIPMEKAEQGVQEELDRLMEAIIPERELQKIINKTEARISYSEINYQNKANNLAFFEFLGEVDLINHEQKIYENISPAQIRETARHLFKPENCSTLLYLK